MARFRVPVLLLALTWVANAGAAEDRLRIDLRVDVPVTAAVMALGWVMPGPAKGTLQCTSCSTGFDQQTRSLLRAEHQGNARRASNLLVSTVIPVGVLGASALSAWQDGSPRKLLEDALVIGQAVFFAGDLNAGAKRLVPRTRPDGGGGSFYSSHTSRAFTLVTAAATVATIRGRPHARWLWVGGLTLASAVGYFRVAGDAHWGSDVVAGAVAGSAVGFAVPWLMHRGIGRARGLRPSPGGLALDF